MTKFCSKKRVHFLDYFWRFLEEGDKKNIFSLSHVILLKNVIFVVHLILSKKGFQRARESNTVAINKKKKNIQKFAHTATKVFHVFFLKPIETTMWFSLRCDKYVFFLKTCFFLGMENQQSKRVPEKKKVAVPVSNDQRETNHTGNSLDV